MGEDGIKLMEEYGNMSPEVGVWMADLRVGRGLDD